MQLDEAKQILNRAGLIAEEIEWGSRPKFYPSKKAVKKAPPVEDVEDDDDDEVSPVAKEKIKELAQRLSDAGFVVRTGIGWAGPFVSLKKTKIGPVVIVYEEDDDIFAVECDDGGQVNLNGDYEEDFPDFIGFLNGKNNF